MNSCCRFFVKYDSARSFFNLLYTKVFFFFGYFLFWGRLYFLALLFPVFTLFLGVAGDFISLAMLFLLPILSVE